MIHVITGENVETIILLRVGVEFAVFASYSNSQTEGH